MRRGYVKLWRKITDSGLWYANARRKASPCEAWLDLLMTANHKPGTVTIGYQTIPIARGEEFVSVRYLAKRWRWSKDAVMRFLRRLTSEGMITQKPCREGRHLTICKYGTYQDDRDTGETPTAPPPASNASTPASTPKPLDPKDLPKGAGHQQGHRRDANRYTSGYKQKKVKNKKNGRERVRASLSRRRQVADAPSLSLSSKGNGTAELVRLLAHKMNWGKTNLGPVEDAVERLLAGVTPEEVRSGIEAWAEPDMKPWDFYDVFRQRTAEARKAEDRNRTTAEEAVYARWCDLACSGKIKSLISAAGAKAYAIMDATTAPPCIWLDIDGTRRVVDPGSVKKFKLPGAADQDFT